MNNPIPEIKSESYILLILGIMLLWFICSNILLGIKPFLTILEIFTAILNFVTFVSYNK